MRKLIVLDDILAEDLTNIAKSKGLSVVGLIRMILIAYVKKYKK